MHDYSISMTFSTRLQLNIFWFAAIRPTIQKSIKYSLWQRQHKMHNFRLKLKLKRAGKLIIVLNGKKRYSKVEYLGCLLEQTMSGESMPLKTIKKVNFM